MKKVYLIRGPFPGKDDRAFCICEVNGKRRKINYAKYLLLKEGVEVGKYEQVHHIDENKCNDAVENLVKIKPFKHKYIHRSNKNE